MALDLSSGRAGASGHRRATDPRLFWFVTVTWIVGAPVAYFAGPVILSPLGGWPPDFPVGARAALVFAWLTILFSGVAAWNLIRRAQSLGPVDLAVPAGVADALKIPPQLRSWVLGALAILIGYLISTTVFR